MEENKVTEVVEETTETKEPEVKVEDLLSEIATLKAEITKQKSTLDKTLKEKGEVTKKLRERQSEEEKQIEDQKRVLEELEAYKRRDKVSEIEKSYLAMKYSSADAKALAEAMADGDLATAIEIQRKHSEELEKSLKADAVRSMPVSPITNGGSVGITQEEFDSMSLTDRAKLKRENPSEYARLVNK